MLFSATVPKWVKKLVKQYLNGEGWYRVALPGMVAVQLGTAAWGGRRRRGAQLVARVGRWRLFPAAARCCCCALLVAHPQLLLLPPAPHPHSIPLTHFLLPPTHHRARGH